MNLDKYQTIIFDCDGVILKSNELKTESFRKALNNYESKLVNEFINFHKLNGGISRYEKIKIFINDLLPKFNISIQNDSYEEILSRYSRFCKESLLNAEVAEGLIELREITNHAKWLIVSGGDQYELRDTFLHKKIDYLFNGGIFGSPDSKNMIIQREFLNKNIIKPALFIGDSKLDYFAAKSNNLDFIFLSDWTDFKDYEKFCTSNNIVIKKNLESIISNIN